MQITTETEAILPDVKKKVEEMKRNIIYRPSLVRCQEYIYKDR